MRASLFNGFEFWRPSPCTRVVTDLFEVGGFDCEHIITFTPPTIKRFFKNIITLQHFNLYRRLFFGVAFGFHVKQNMIQEKPNQKRENEPQFTFWITEHVQKVV
tara:strand:+ start:619 stop:930 length:312 start_codon:yes stop_codon:yes gene_type:complete